MLELSVWLRLRWGEGGCRWGGLGSSVADMLALKSELGRRHPEPLQPVCSLRVASRIVAETLSGTLRPDAPPLACAACQWVPRLPVTLPCGHTACRPCLRTVCPECRLPLPERLELNVTVRAAVEKWWPRHLEAEFLREQGEQLLRQNHLLEALEMFNTALSICGDDHLLLEARSEVLFKLDRIEHSLQDAILATHLRPYWSKGYFRKGVALSSLGQYEDAFLSFALCVALEKSSDRLINEFIKVLQKLLFPSSKRISLSHRWASNYISSSHEANSKLEEDEIVDSFNRTVISGEPMMESRKLNFLFSKVLEEIEKVKKFESAGRHMLESAESMEPEDFECVLCCRTLWQPVTTPCGHTYCTVCLDRSLDYSPNCPLCMTPLSQYVGSSDKQVTVFLEVALAMGLPMEYRSRLGVHRAELAALSNAPEVSIFVCTTTYPTVSCPLYVFEPRYRLMVRRAVESGTRQFGMCAYTHQTTSIKSLRFAEYGTMIEIKDWVLLNDGCSILSCIGVKRFRVISRSERDGYDTAQVQYLSDDAISTHSLPEITELHDRVREQGLRWFSRMSQDMQTKILRTFGNMPSVEEDWHTLNNGPAWAWWLVAILPLGHHLQVGILKTTCLAKRLKAIEKTLKHFEEGQQNSQCVANQISVLKEEPQQTRLT